jgi:hypothetical protein
LPPNRLFHALITLYAARATCRDPFVRGLTRLPSRRILPNLAILGFAA